PNLGGARHWRLWPKNYPPRGKSHEPGYACVRPQGTGRVFVGTAEEHAKGRLPAGAYRRRRADPRRSQTARPQGIRQDGEGDQDGIATAEPGWHFLHFDPAGWRAFISWPVS